MEFERNKRAIRPVSLVPLINVVFLLLIFFLVAGTVEKVEVIDVEPPKAVSGDLLEEGPVRILLGQHNEVIINDTPVTLENVGNHIADALKDNPGRLITIKADARLSASRMVEVMNRVKAAGGRQVSMITQPL